MMKMSESEREVLTYAKLVKDENGLHVFLSKDCVEDWREIEIPEMMQGMAQAYMPQIEAALSSEN